MTKRKSMSAAEREIRIELVRARAALERKRLLRSTERLSQEANPAALVKSLLPAGLFDITSASPRHWVSQAVSLARRYPLLLSSLSTLVPVLGRRSKLVRLGTGLLLGWRFVQKAAKTRR